MLLSVPFYGMENANVLFWLLLYLHQWCRKIFFYGDAHTFLAIVVQWMGSIIFHYSEVERVPEPGGSKTSLATTRQLGSRFIVYSPRVCDRIRGVRQHPAHPRFLRHCTCTLYIHTWLLVHLQPIPFLCL